MTTPVTNLPLGTGTIWRVVLAVGLGMLVGFSFLGQPIGLFIPVFISLLLAVLAYLTLNQGVLHSHKNIWIVLAVVFFAILAVVRAAGFSIFYNLSAVILLLIWLAHVMLGPDMRTFGIYDYLWRPILSSLEIAFPQPVDALDEALKSFRANRSPVIRLLTVLRGLVLALPVIIIFALLLASADPFFHSYLNNFLKFLHLDNMAELVARLIVSGIAAWLILGGLTYALRQREPEVQREAGAPPTPGWLGFTETAIILGGVDLLFTAFVAVQLRYFFGGHQNITPDGFTYAEYTRRGFAELVLVAVFSLGLGLALQAWTRLSARRTRIGFKILAALLVGLTGIILASAFQRLLLYEEAYGFTQLRTFVHIFMFWIVVLLLVYLLTLHTNRPRIFVFCMFLAFLGFGATLDILNTDAFIVHQNMTRYARTGKLDAEYLATLSDDAVPGLLAAMDAVPPVERAILGSALHFRLNTLQNDQPKINWAGWHWARYQALRLLSSRQAELESFTPRRYEWTFPIE